MSSLYHRTSCLNTLCTSFVLIGLGIICGFLIFHSTIHTRYVERLHRTEQTHNRTLAVFRDKYIEANHERKRCIDIDDERLEDMSELRGRLDAQYKSWRDLTETQRSLYGQHQEKINQVNGLQLEIQNEKQAFESLEAELKRKDKDLAAFRVEIETNSRIKIELETEFKKIKETNDDKLNKFKEEIEEKDNEISNIKKKYEKLDQEKDQLNDELLKIKKQYETLDQEKNQLDDELLNTKKEYETLDQDKNKLDDELSNVKKGYETLFHEKNQLDNEILNIKKQNETLNQEKNQLERGIQKIQNSLNGTQFQLKKKDEELSLLKSAESNLENKLLNLREGMLDLLKEKIDEIRNLKNRVDTLSEEKVFLENKLYNMQNGMLDLVKEKMNEVDTLKSDLYDSQERIKELENEIETLQLERADSTISIKAKIKTIQDHDSNDVDYDESTKAIMNEIEELKAELKESQGLIDDKENEIESFKFEQNESKRLINNKMKEIETLKSESAKERASTKESMSTLESDLHKTKELVIIKTNEAKKLNLQLEEFVSEIDGLKSDLFNVEMRSAEETAGGIMINHVQNRDNVMCHQLFGRGPYYVKFVINEMTESAKNYFFVIEISHRKDLPHSIYTFLTLVESGLYNDGASFLSSRDGVLQIGGNSSEASGNSISLEHKLKRLGMPDGSALSFQERSTSKNTKCGQNSVGFVDRGPQLNLFVSSPSDDNEVDCFGQVIRGQENLHVLQSLLQESEKIIKILTVTYLRVD